MGRSRRHGRAGGAARDGARARDARATRRRHPEGRRRAEAGPDPLKFSWSGHARFANSRLEPRPGTVNRSLTVCAPALPSMPGFAGARHDFADRMR